MSVPGNVYRPPQWNQDDAPPLEPFRPTFAATIDDRPIRPPEWIVDGVAQRQAVCLMAGAPKIGKSLALQQLLSATALGQDWLGRVTVKARCFALFCEDSDEWLRHRQKAINTFYDVEPPDYETGLSWDARDIRDGTLVNFDRYSDKPQVTDLWRQLWAHVDDNGIEVVALDPAGVVFGGNENFKRQVTVFIRELHKQASRINGSVIIAAHPPKADPRGFAGNTAWHGSVRLGLSLQRPANYDDLTDTPRDERLLRSLGGNYVPGKSVDRLKIRQGVFVVDEPEPDERPGRFSPEELKYRLLKGLRRQLENGAKVAADDMHPTSMPSRARRSPDLILSRTPFNSLYAAVEQMLANGDIIRVKVRGQCLVRPKDGPAYENEEVWVVE